MTEHRWEPRLERLPGYAAGLTGIALVVHTVVTVFRYRFPMPYWDTTSAWNALFNARDAGEVWRLLLGGLQSAEHRAIFPVWVFLADVLWGDGRGLLMISTSMVFLIAAVAVLVLSALRSYDLSTADRAGVVALMAAPMFSLVHILLARPVHVMHYTQAVGTCVAFVAAAGLDRRIRADRDAPTFLYLAVIATGHLVGSFSFGNGLIGWPATLALAVVRRWPLRVVLPLSALAIGTAVIFAVASGSSIGGVVPLASTGLDDFFLYALAYLSNPLALALAPSTGEAAARPLAMGLTAIGVCWLAVSAFRALRRPAPPPRPFEIVQLQLLLYCVGGALLTATARSSLGVEQAFAPRYSVHGAWIWVALLGSSIGAAGSARNARRVATVAALTAVVLLPAQLDGVRRLRGAQEYLRPAYVALVVGANDESVLERIFPPVDALRVVADRMRETREGLFSERPAGWLGRPLEDLFEVVPKTVGGTWSATSIRSDPASTKIAGAVPGGSEFDWWVIVDTEGVVRGLARRARGGGAAVSWDGYVAAPPPLDGFGVYAVDEAAGRVREVGRPGVDTREPEVLH